MKFATRFAHWLETRGVAPAYSGWLLSGAAAFFFLAASNTLAGWLYVISGMIVALNAIAAWLARRNLRGLTVSRRPILPVSAGDDLVVELHLKNATPIAKTLLQVDDGLPHGLGQSQPAVVEIIAPQSTYTLVYRQATKHRGVYQWQTVQMRTAAPLGLFWCQRQWLVPAMAIVYPQVLPLSQSPLVDEIGRSTSLTVRSDRRPKAATEGQTKSIRPYRWGDPTRLIHWRTSARYGELRVRELELLTGGQELLISLDNTAAWPAAQFEAAVIAAASLYFYAVRRQLNVALWTPTTGAVQGKHRVLEVLAAIVQEATAHPARWPALPLVWLTPDVASLTTLPAGSRWVLWPSPAIVRLAPSPLLSPGIIIQPDQPLQPQLQLPLTR
jgi:uncharacterized protein (DUF58 family)